MLWAQRQLASYRLSLQSFSIHFERQTDRHTSKRRPQGSGASSQRPSEMWDSLEE